MQNNIFMVSDASYSHQTKIAGIGVVDLHSGKKYSMSINNAKGVQEVELRALIYSIEIAIEKKYDHVVFVYDNQSLKLEKLKEYTENKFASAQFLWLKRVYTDEADKVALKARKLQEELFKKANKKIKIKDIPIDKITQKLTNKQILEVIKSKSAKTIISSCSVIATKKEKIILKHYIDNNKNIPNDLILRANQHEFFKFIYYMLAKNDKISFYSFIRDITLGVLNVQDFKCVKKESYYINSILKVVDALKIQRKKHARIAST